MARKTETEQRNEWKRNLSATYFDSPNLKYGMKFEHKDMTYTVIGRNDRSKTCPIMCEGNNRIFMFPVKIAKAAK